MTNELVQSIVLKTGGSWGDATPEDRQFFRRFAELVAAHERDACLNCYSPDDTATDWADKIRARGET